MILYFNYNYEINILINVYTMKVQNALVVVSILLALYVLLYNSGNLVNSPVGKLILVGGVLAITYHYGKVPGVLSAAVAVLLLHNDIEGMENKDETTESGDSESDSEEESDGKTITITENVDETITESDNAGEKKDADEKSSEEDEEAEREQKAAAVSTQNIVAQEEACRPKQSNEVNDTASQEGFIGGGAIEPMACHSSVLQGSYLS